jgi:hypothetical protein
MPVEHGLGPDQEEVASPVLVEAVDHEPEELVANVEARPALGAEGDLELLAEEQVLEEESLAAAEGANEGGPEEADEFDHPRQDRRATGTPPQVGGAECSGRGPSWRFEKSSDFELGPRRLDLVENRLEDEVMDGLEGVMPDRRALTDGLAIERVPNKGPTLDGLPLEPVLTRQPVRVDDAKGAERPRTLELLPNHRPRLVQTVSQRTWRRRDLGRPDRVEVQDEPSQLLRRRGDDALVTLADPHG